MNMMEWVIVLYATIKQGLKYEKIHSSKKLSVVLSKM